MGSQRETLVHGLIENLRAAGAPSPSAQIGEDGMLVVQTGELAALSADARERIEALIASAQSAVAAACALSGAESSERGLVLIADDDPSIRTLLRTILGRAGYGVAEAADGRQAVERARELQPDLVVLDWEMPYLDGRDAAAELKGDLATAELPIVMLTSRSRIEDKVDALGVGVQDFITKPFDYREFMARIEQQVRWKRLLDARREATASIAIAPVVVASPEAAPLSPLARCRGLLSAGEHERALTEGMQLAETSEEARAYEDAAQAYAIAAEAAVVVKNPDIANKLQRLSGKMYLLLAENATDPAAITRGYTMSAKMFLTAGNLKLARDVASRQSA
jgi:CheY-like chemotaxis protein